MKKATALLFVLFTSITIYAQDWPYDKNWIFSYSSSKGVQMTFDKDTMNMKQIKKTMQLDFTNNTISDKNGNLLFYTNGCEIHDGNHKMITNGYGLVEGPIKTQCAYGMPYAQMSTFLLYEKTDTAQMVQTDLDENYEGSQIKLFTVSMSNKKILSKAIIIEDSIRKGYIKAVKHSNGKDWWVIINNRNFDYYISLLIGKQGLIQQKKTLYPQKGKFSFGYGQVNFSMDGKYYIKADYNNGLQLYSFDRCTGQLHNKKQLNYPISQDFFDQFASGVCFSPNNRFLYASITDSLFQFDLDAVDISASRTLIDTVDRTFFDGTLNATFYLMENAPDGRIYMCCTSGVRYMHFINRPNEKGRACDFRQHGIDLLISSRNIPSLSNYRLGPSSVVCTTATTELSSVTPRIYPNPTQDILHIEAENGEAIQRIEVYNTIGELVHIADYQTIEILLSTAAFPNGIYFLRVEYSNKKVSATKFIVLR